MKRFLFVFAALLLLLTATSAFADDLYPPSWRGQPGTTYQAWEFSTPNPITAPDVVNNPYGTPSAHAYPGTSQNWIDQWGGRQGMWPLSGTIEITIPNNPVPNPYKDIWVQLTWAKQVQSSGPDVWEMNSGVHGTLVQQTALSLTGYPSPNNYWYQSVYLIRLQPNPSWETVKIDGTIVVDEVVIDTICAPEPSSLLVISFGLAGLAAWRRKR